MQIGDILDRSAIALRVSATDKRQILAHVAEIAARNFGLDASLVLDALTERENAGSTGIGHGVAAPHARVEGLDRIHGVFLRVDQPLEFDAIDDQPVDLIFALLAPPEAGTEHLRALARVSRMLRSADLREHLRQARSQDALYALLVQEATPSAA
ncbi:MAG: PTS IIA-like nitrogen regulatory protein PtsN [Phenylobacterium sp.]|uniref:PTS IIA-like nitrogen regulatory protein PtsN n=1 Tax=Phenylobacterium sp. TaxID=1871053 RepID=UPI00391D6DB9